MTAPFSYPETVIVDFPLVIVSTASADLALVPGGAGFGREERDMLRALCRKSSAPAAVVKRAGIVMALLFDKKSVSSVAAEFHVTRDTVRLRAERFRAAPTLFSLENRPRSGRTCRISFADEGVVLSIVCQRPGDFGRCEGRMAQALIAEEATHQGSKVSRSSVQRILAHCALGSWRPPASASRSYRK